MMADQLRAVSQYLQRYAEAEASLAGTHIPGPFQRALVVPMYRESPQALQHLLDLLAQNPGTLLILVANRPVDDNEIDWYQQLLHCLPGQPRRLDRRNTLQCWHTAAGSAVLVVDRVVAGEPLAAHQGVGLARKIGADIACQLIHTGAITSPWVAHTDADTVLPSGYFEALQAQPVAAAIIFPYTHIAGEEAALHATRLYEFSLHQYVEGLRWAGSPYAFHTLGSTLAVHYYYYAAVRGFPVRNAAEDFYLLNKLAKVGPITSLDGPQIAIRARRSERVPFGTGPGIARIEALADPLDTPLYHPAVFAYLRAMLDFLQQLAQQPRLDWQLCETLVKAQDPRLQPGLLRRYCEGIDIESQLDHCRRQCRHSDARRQQLHNWFDGFRTLKLVNFCRDQALGSIPFRDWLECSAGWRQTGNRHMRTLYRQLTGPTCSPPRARE